MRLTLELSPESRQSLEKVWRTHAKYYVRVKALAMLKIADGIPAYQVASSHLGKPYRKNTVYDWYHLYVKEGISSFEVREGRGRKPCFSPHGC